MKNIIEPSFKVMKFELNCYTFLLKNVDMNIISKAMISIKTEKATGFIEKNEIILSCKEYDFKIKLKREADKDILNEINNGDSKFQFVFNDKEDNPISLAMPKFEIKK